MTKLRAYTVAEIDALRHKVRERMTFMAVLPDSAEVEDQVRTYMLGGVTADDIPSGTWSKAYAKSDGTPNKNYKAELVTENYVIIGGKDDD